MISRMTKFDIDELLFLDDDCPPVTYCDEIILLEHLINKNLKMLPLERKNIHKNENRRLGLIKSLHIRHCYM